MQKQSREAESRALSPRAIAPSICLPRSLALALAGTIFLAAGSIEAVGEIQHQRCNLQAPNQISDTAAIVLDEIFETPGALANSPTQEEYLLTTCNRLAGVYVDGPAIFGAARDLIAQAEHEVNLAFYNWEAACEAAGLIGDGLILAQENHTSADPLLVRFLVDDISGGAVNELWDSVLDWVGRGLDRSRIEIQLATSGSLGATATLHDKLIVVDAKWLFVTGANVQAQNDVSQAWHDTAYVLEGDAALAGLSAFEQVWHLDLDGILNNPADTRYWFCIEEIWPSCFELDGGFDDPDRSWLPSGSQSFGGVPVVATGKTHSYLFLDTEGSETDNPQAIAWLTAMQLAEEHIHIETPNINAQAFVDAVVAAVGRGVTVKLITSLGFNHTWANLFGGDNQEVVGDIRQAIRALYPGQEEGFQLRWYSRDGVEPIEGNGYGASHTKYMTVDDKLAIVGSGNQDYFAWDVSHEFNVLLDNPGATAEVEAAVFGPDWDTAIGSYLELYEGNGATQELVCPIAATPGLNKNVRFSDTEFCDNDEARSLILHDLEEGQVIRFYDDPDRDHEDDDWTEIIVKRPIAHKLIHSLEDPIDDEDVRVIVHRDNGLDGKISAAEIAIEPIGTVIDLYEGNFVSGDLVCSNRIDGSETILFQDDPHCENDEARSSNLYDLQEDQVVVLYDSPSGSLNDDWTMIIPKIDLPALTLTSFETDLSNAAFAVVNVHDNGLDGKVSRLEVGTASDFLGVATLYEGNNGKQDQLCDLLLQDQTEFFQLSDTCENDEARSLRLSLAKANTLVMVYDDPLCRPIDDYALIYVKRDLKDKLIGTFEFSFEDDDVIVEYQMGGNLDGKVSCARIVAP